MKSILTNDPAILSWKEIKEKYPHQWVGMVNITWKNKANIKCAEVKYKQGDSDELLMKVVKGEEPDMMVEYTSPDEDFFMPFVESSYDMTVE